MFSFCYTSNIMKELFIPVILGTARNGRASETAARFVLDLVKASGHRTKLVDPRRFIDKPITNGSSKKIQDAYRDLVAEADGFILVVPEYNHGYPGELKLMMDQAYKEYTRKPIGVMGVSQGALGGARVVDLIRPTLTAYNLVVSNKTHYFVNASPGMKLSKKGDGTRAQGVIDDVAWFAQVLKNAREDA